MFTLSDLARIAGSSLAKVAGEIEIHKTFLSKVSRGDRAAPDGLIWRISVVLGPNVTSRDVQKAIQYGKELHAEKEAREAEEAQEPGSAVQARKASARGC